MPLDAKDSPSALNLLLAIKNGQGLDANFGISWLDTDTVVRVIHRRKGI